MKVSFLDFWGDFNKRKNFFLFLFQEVTNVEVVDDPSESDVIIYSCFGQEHKNYKNKIRIFYTGENIRPDYNECDFAFSFDFTENGKNIRLPLWMLQIDWFNKIDYDNPKYTIPYNLIDDNQFTKRKKTNFCCTVFNSPSPFRYELVTELNRYKPVHCYGKPFGNWFYGEDKKYDIISNYKFNICLENSIYPGYYTEKPIHAKVAGCIPIYWSDEHMSIDFNSNAFINLSSFNNNIKELTEYIIEVDSNEELYKKISSEKLFNHQQDPKILFNILLEKIQVILK